MTRHPALAFIKAEGFSHGATRGEADAAVHHLLRIGVELGSTADTLSYADVVEIYVPFRIALELLQDAPGLLAGFGFRS